jgi:hypothetical protein
MIKKAVYFLIFLTASILWAAEPKKEDLIKKTQVGNHTVWSAIKDNGSQPKKIKFVVGCDVNYGVPITSYPFDPSRILVRGSLKSKDPVVAQYPKNFNSEKSTDKAMEKFADFIDRVRLVVNEDGSENYCLIDEDDHSKISEVIEFKKSEKDDKKS